MKLQTISFEVAKDLKDLEFDWPVKKYFDNKGKPITYILGKPHWNFYKRPTQALVVKWFRDNHNISINITWSTYLSGFQYNIVLMTIDAERIFYNSAFESYEEAELEGIKQALKYLKNGK